MPAATSISILVTRAHQTADPYLYVPIDVPPGTTRMDVAFAYRKAEDCVIDLGLFDPDVTAFPSTGGFRGWSGGARDSFFIATDDATPGYIPGPLRSGQWRIVLGLHKVPAAGVEVTIRHVLDDAPRRLITPQPRTSPARHGSGWYKGDLHCHTHHSDARGAPHLLHAAARQVGLDFLAVSDHNTTSQRRYFDAHSSPDLIFIRATEITTAGGHANVFGVDGFVDFRLTQPAHPHVLADIVRAKGGLLSINHDKAELPWRHALPQIDCMEVWQSAWLMQNWISRERYQQRLAAGLRIAAIGGSDFHQPERLLPEGPLVLARPTTVLWLEELSEDAVLAAMKAGRGYVTESPSGPHLAISAHDKSMGERIAAGPIEATADVRGASGDELVWLDATGILVREPIAEDDWTGRYEGTPQMFLRAEIYAKASRRRLLDEFKDAIAGKALAESVDLSEIERQPILRALSNPIWIDR